MADGKRYANHRKDLLPTFLVSKKTKRNGGKPHTQIEMPQKILPAVHPALSFEQLGSHVSLVIIRFFGPIVYCVLGGTVVFDGGYFFLTSSVGEYFLPCTKGEGVKNLRHTKSSIYMYVTISAYNTF